MDTEEMLRIGGRVPLSDLKEMTPSIGVLVQYESFYPEETEDIKELFIILSCTDNDVVEYLGDIVPDENNALFLARDFYLDVCKIPPEDLEMWEPVEDEEVEYAEIPAELL